MSESRTATDCYHCYHYIYSHRPGSSVAVDERYAPRVRGWCVGAGSLRRVRGSRCYLLPAPRCMVGWGLCPPMLNDIYKHSVRRWTVKSRLGIRI